jgi:hypothetical protein
MTIKKSNQPARYLGLSIATLFAVVIGGCGGPSGSEGFDITEIVLPTDTLLNLNCPEVGVYPEQCVLEDPENPYVTAATPEFDVNNPDALIKFDLANEIPVGPTGAKARFYLWATALARRDFGENQFYTALALHELYTAAGDPIIREQALKAYRSVWDNFFDDDTVFECCGEFFPFPRDDVGFGFPLKELVLENLLRARDFRPTGYPDGFTPLIPDDPSTVNNDPGLIELESLDVITEWGYLQICTADRDCRVEKIDF